jgi:hypothetical protein
MFRSAELLVTALFAIRSQSRVVPFVSCSAETSVLCNYFGDVGVEAARARAEHAVHGAALIVFRTVSRNILRALESRDITVPIGMESASAISW